METTAEVEIPDVARRNVESALTITVAGRKFRGCTEPTYERDLYVMDLSERSGLDRLAASFDVERGKIDALSEAMILQAWRSGTLFALLGAALDEEGVPWTIARAEANAMVFRGLTKREDKDALRGSVVAVIMSFFVRGLLSSLISKSLDESATNDSSPQDRSTMSESPPQKPHAESGEQIVNNSTNNADSPNQSNREPSTSEAPTTSESGMALFAPSPDTTSTNTPAS